MGRADSLGEEVVDPPRGARPLKLYGSARPSAAPRKGCGGIPPYRTTSPFTTLATEALPVLVVTSGCVTGDVCCRMSPFGIASCPGLRS